MNREAIPTELAEAIDLFAQRWMAWRSQPTAGPRCDNPDWLTVPEAAAVAGVKERTIWRWVAAGRVASTLDADGLRRIEYSSLPRLL